MSDLRLSDADEVLLESLVLSAADNVAKAESSKRANHAPTRRRAYVETDTDNVYLGTGSQWVDVSENTGILSALFAGGDLTANSIDSGSVTTDSASVTNQVDAGSVNTDDETINNSSTRPLDTGVIGDNPTDYVDQSGEILRQSVDQIEVSTSPTAIADVRGSAYMIVIGTSNLDDVGGKRFIDRVTAFGFGGESATELATKSLPDARTYSVNGNKLDLAMAADTYKVNVINTNYAP